MLKIYVCCLVPRFYDAENGVLTVQFPVHVMNRAPEQTIHRMSEVDNKTERKRWRSMAVIMSMS